MTKRVREPQRQCPSELLLLVLLTSLMLTTYPARSYSPDTADNEKASIPYVFAWPFIDRAELVSPRGGTSRGASVTLATGPSPHWQALQEAGITPLERDRRAILAMAGEFRTSFDFLETVVFAEQPEPSQPYRSWSTEKVYVVHEAPDFISLQHIIVMYFVGRDEQLHGPIVQKHWRQDWHYEPAHIVEFIGEDTWQSRPLPRKERRGNWSQTVYQVDDTPRYAGLGRWQHTATHSAWRSNEVWRPLPRRERTVRDDYQVLAGSNNHLILPNGWVHEQHNRKLQRSFAAVDDDDDDDETMHAIAHEAGINRYDLIKDFDFSAGDQYWRYTGSYWAMVRQAWDEKFKGARSASKNTFPVARKCNGTPAFMIFFAEADKYAGSAIGAHGVDTGAGGETAQGPEKLRAWVKKQITCLTQP